LPREEVAGSFAVGFVYHLPLAFTDGLKVQMAGSLAVGFQPAGWQVTDGLKVK